MSKPPMSVSERQRRRKKHLQKCEAALIGIVEAYEESERELEAGDEPGDSYDLLWGRIYAAADLLRNR